VVGYKGSIAIEVRKQSENIDSRVEITELASSGRKLSGDKEGKIWEDLFFLMFAG